MKCSVIAPICRRGNKGQAQIRRPAAALHLLPQSVHRLSLHTLPQLRSTNALAQVRLVHSRRSGSLLAILFNRLDPKALGNDYLIIGTVERKVWREGLRRPKIINEILPHVADFKEVRRVEVRPAGWYSAEK